MFGFLAMLLLLNCLILGDESNGYSLSKLQRTKMSASLKIWSKSKHAYRLYIINGSHLNLWKCSILADDKLQETLSNIFFQYPWWLPWLPISPLASFTAFCAGLSLETIHILVQLPLLGNYGTSISYSTTEGCFYGMLLGLTAVPMTQTASLDPNLGTAEVYSCKWDVL